MREAKNGEDAADAEGGWLDWLRDCGVAGDHRRRHPRARPPHPRPRARCAAASSRPSSPRPRRASAIDAEPSMDGADFARDGDPGRAGRDRRRRPARRRHRHRDQALDHPPVPRARLPADAAAVHGSRRRGPRARPRPRLPRQRPGRPGGARLRRRHRPRAGRQEAGGRHLPRPPAPLPGGRPRDLQAPLRPPRRQPPGQGPRDRQDRHHLAEPRLRRRPPGRRARRSRPTSRCAGRPTSAPPSSPT